MNEENEVSQSPGISGGMKLVTSIACIATILEVTTQVVNGLGGDGIQMLDENGDSLDNERVQELVARMLHNRAQHPTGVVQNV